MDIFEASKYSIVVSKVHEDGEDLFFAYVKEIPDISSYGDSYADVYENCIDSLKVLHADAIENGKIFPHPQKEMPPSAPSGRITLRMSRSMHADISRRADEDGVSLNQWIVEAVSQRRGYYVKCESPSSVSTFISNSIRGIFNPSDNNANSLTNPLRLSSTDGKYIHLPS